jgi:hypothetical protein
MAGMEERRGRSKFVDPFTPKPQGDKTKSMFCGFLRSAPMHRWRLAHVVPILEFIARRPTLFGLPDATTCVVNTSHMLPSARSRRSGITVFGKERGCKTIVIPPSCSGHPFDDVDAKMMEPLFRWNPSADLVYLSKECEQIAPQLAQFISKTRTIKRVTMVDWESAAAVNRVVMACKSLEVVDVMSPDESSKNWHNEESVEAMCEMIEMHPKIRAIHGTQPYLHTIFDAVTFSRCKHNVALVPMWCRYARFYKGMWFLSVTLIALAVAYMVHAVLEWVLPDRRYTRDAVWVVVFLGGSAAIMAIDYFRFKYSGRSWTFFARYLCLLRRRLDRSVTQ